MGVAHGATPDEPVEPSGRDAEELSATAQLIRAELPRWKIAMGEDAAALTLNPKPILRWTNPATGRMHGEIYLWTGDGRPEAVMSLYKVWEPAWGFSGEFLSLSPATLVGERSQTVAWRSDTPGIVFRDVPDAPPPAGAAPRRLQQMRSMANDFTAVLIDYRQNSEGERQSLRLLTNPLYRYSSPKNDVVDGALFAFVVGTDVEVFLLLEARGTKDVNRWQYALARLNSDEIAAFWKEQEVWRVDKATFNERNNPYVFMNLPEPAAQ
ncbi:MAG TPA: hypothetical protein VG826_28705 [Pirellulales bacterium]|nr:hypothetical protein [Pirellulales bacterium]